MALSAGNAAVLVPTFQPGDHQHRRRIATWATVVNNDIVDIHGSLSAIDTAVINLQTNIASISQSVSANAVIVAMVAGVESTAVYSAGVNTVVKPYLTPFMDTHNAMNTSSGVYTVPLTGLYKIHGAVLFSAVAMTAATEIYCEIQKNGGRSNVGWLAIDATVTNYQMVRVDALLSCSAGDTIVLHAQTPSTVNLYAGAGDGRFYNQLQIHKVK